MASADDPTPLSDDDAMELALVEARAAAAQGEVPVGAVAMIDGRALSARHNERERTGDPTAHAEMLALRDAAAAVGGWRLSDVTLVVTLEPCPMCAGALVAARVCRLVYGASDPRAGACGTLYNLCGDPRLNHELKVTHGLRADDCGALLTSFFAEKRTDRTVLGAAPVTGGRPDPLPINRRLICEGEDRHQPAVTWQRPKTALRTIGLFRPRVKAALPGIFLSLLFAREASGGTPL